MLDEPIRKVEPPPPPPDPVTSEALDSRLGEHNQLGQAWQFRLGFDEALGRPIENGTGGELTAALFINCMPPAELGRPTISFKTSKTG